MSFGFSAVGSLLNRSPGLAGWPVPTSWVVVTSFRVIPRLLAAVSRSLVVQEVQEVQGVQEVQEVQQVQKESQYVEVVPGVTEGRGCSSSQEGGQDQEAGG